MPVLTRKLHDFDYYINKLQMLWRFYCNGGPIFKVVFECKNIAKGTTDPGVDYFNQLLWFGLVELV